MIEIQPMTALKLRLSVLHALGCHRERVLFAKAFKLEVSWRAYHKVRVKTGVLYWLKLAQYCFGLGASRTFLLLETVSAKLWKMTWKSVRFRFCKRSVLITHSTRNIFCHVACFSAEHGATSRCWQLEETALQHRNMVGSTN